MNRYQKKQNNQQKTKASLYDFVFCSYSARFGSFLLFFVVFLQPLAPVFAAEDATSETVVIEESVEEIIVEPESEPAEAVDKETQDETVLHDEVEVTKIELTLTNDSRPVAVDTIQSETLAEETVSAQAPSESSQGDELVIDETENIVPVVPAGDVATTTEITGNASSTVQSIGDQSEISVSSTTATSTTSPSILIDDPEDQDTSEGNSSSSSAEEVVGTTSVTEIIEEFSQDSDSGTETEIEAQNVADTTEAVATTSEEVTTPVLSAMNATTSATSTEGAVERLDTIIRNSDNFHQFAQTECVEVSEGAYYCAEAVVDTVGDIDDALYSDRDADGDYEIFLARAGEVTQITHNILDDKAPYYDSHSKTIVWHRLIDDRYQIVSYDVESGEETVLTNNSINDMEPARYGDVTVWQRWVVDNWEIMMQQGEIVTQLTDNATHDIAPKISDTHIMWYSTGQSETKVIKVYDLKTTEITTIEDVEGGDIDNVRMVLVFDTVFENGDILTQGYDLESKEVIPLQALPGELPDELPDSDSTGETRALIQNKSNSVKNEVVEVGDDSLVKTASSTVNLSTPTTTQSAAVAVSHAEATLDLSSASTTLDSTEVTEPSDVVVSSTTTQHIPDVVIPQVLGTTIDETR